MSENSSCDTDDVSDYGDEIPPEMIETAKEVSLNLLPDKSKRLYVSTYNVKPWRATKNSFSKIVYATLISSSFATLVLKNSIRHAYFVEPHGTRFKKKVSATRVSSAPSLRSGVN